MAALCELACGQTCTIASLGSLPDDVAARLRCLGFAPGAEVQAVRRAPLGDPVVYRVMGADICLRRAQSTSIEVVPAA